MKRHLSMLAAGLLAVAALYGRRPFDEEEPAVIDRRYNGGATLSERSLRKSAGAYEWGRDLPWQDIFDHVERPLDLCGSAAV